MFSYDPMSCTKICWDDYVWHEKWKHPVRFFVTKNTKQEQTTYNLDPRQRDEE